MVLQATSQLAAAFSKTDCCRQFERPSKEVQSSTDRWGLLHNLRFDFRVVSNEIMLLQLLEGIAMPQQHIHSSSKSSL